jgi:16S rRNA (cytosine967-C5)-methyltransferase
VTANPRSAAFQTLLRIEKERSYADILIDHELANGQLAGPDRGLFTELVYGVLRRQGSLDYIVGQFSSKPPAKLERAVLLLLRLGLYQMFYLDRVPVSAAVNETVKLAKELTPRASGFINAVLRSSDRGREQLRYPDREQDPVAHLAAVHSHPAWLVQLWLGQLGLAEAEALATAMAKPAPLTIRVNSLKTDATTLRQRLAAEGLSAQPCRYAPHGLTLAGHASLAGSASFREGLFTVQDEASQLAALLLAPLPGERVLDLCAAPGGKATYLAQLMENRGTLVACDRTGRKLELIRETAARLGVSCLTTGLVDATQPLLSFLPEPFERILVDAPCTGLGVIRRNPEGKWWKEPADPARLAETQLAILGQAAPLLRPGGVMVYATCSTTLAENEQVIDNFLSRHQDFMIEPVRDCAPLLEPLGTDRGFFRSWPHRDGMDGFFAARLKKKSL